MERKIVYVEPADYFPKEIRKKYKLGEYAETNVEKERTMDKKKLKEIAKQVVVYLETLPDGTELSTWQATKNSYGIANLEDIDLFEIDKQLHIIAKKQELN